MVAQRTPEWLDERRNGISSTDVPILLGLSPYRSEADLAAEKLGQPVAEPDARTARMFRLGLALEDVIRIEDELEHGVKLRRVNQLKRHATIPWALTSLDFERVGERVIVEMKSSRAARWDDGLPQDVEAQVRWQMGVAGYPRAHVAALRSGSELACFDLEHDEDVFAGLVTIAEDFRRRLAEGGPFAENAASVKARYPQDNGAEMVADAEIVEAIHALTEYRAQRKHLETLEEAIETAVKSRMGEHAVLHGPDFKVTWKRTKDSTQVAWDLIADGLLRQLPQEQRDALVSIHTTVRPGFRPFRVVPGKENAA
jgi:putative phage-type endonuclease